MSSAKPPTAQHLFTKVWNWFVVGRNRKSSTRSGVCLYRGPNGSRCAVGACMTNREYRKDMDSIASGGTDVFSVVGRFDHLSHLRPHREMLNDLQNLHDGAKRSRDIPGLLRKFAAKNRYGVHAP
jgi:hypothetical protein